MSVTDNLRGHASKVQASSADQLDRSAGDESKAEVVQAEAAQAAASGYEALLARAVETGATLCGCPGCLKGAMKEQAAADSSATKPDPQYLGDDVPDAPSPDPSDDVTLNVAGGQSIHSQMDHPGDKDFFRVSLSGGETYEFTVVPDDTSGTGPDLMIEIYDEDGNLITTFDGGSFGADEEWDYTPPTDGVYYATIRGYADAAVGGYTITGKIDDDPPDPNLGTPLDAIDWGSRVDTDGRTTADGDEIIHVYFAKVGEVYEASLPPVVVAEGWEDYEKAAAFDAFENYSNVANLAYREVDSADKADFVLTTFSTVPNLLGVMSPPGEPNEGVAAFNKQGVGWTESGLQQGGFGYITLIHEFGHGHGLAHPHDNGGNSTVMNGVEPNGPAFSYTTGDFGLNDGAYTTMSYNEAWQENPAGISDSDDYGYQGTMGAFDIAVLQQKYGANMDAATGDDTYTLWDENAPGTMYACIWDVSGTDKIVAGDAMNVNIDLREATLEYELGGGGWVSYAEGIYGGYTIANGVTIEDATGGAGADVLGGNKIGNELDGRAGNDGLGGRGGADVLFGRDGGDVIYGGRGDDALEGGAGRDFLRGGVGADTFLFRTDAVDGSIDRVFDLETGDTVDLSAIDADTTSGGNQGFTLVAGFSGTAGEAALTYEAARDRTFLWLDRDGDGRADAKIVFDGDQTGFGGFVL